MRITANYSMTNIANKVRGFVSDSIQECGYEALRIAKSTCPVRTGDLRDSLDMTMGTPYRFTIYSGIFYAKFVEKGRGWVRPVNKKVLRWVDHATGRVVFAKASRPSKPNPFMRRAVDRAIANWENRLQAKRWKITESKR